jgi:molybdenum cofactor biosynthesis enzyme MoaA
MNTIYRLIKLNRLLKSYRLKIAGILCADLFRVRHLFIRMDPVLGCNLRCAMCFFSIPETHRTLHGSFSNEEIHRIAEMFFPMTLQLVVGCIAEPTLFRGLTNIFTLAKAQGVPFTGLATNGQLLSEGQVQELACTGLNEIIVSMHGVRKETYERLMVGASYEKLHDTLSILSREAGREKPALRINYTVNPDNLAELADFFTVFGKYRIATLQVRVIMDFGRTIYQKKDLSASAETYHVIIKGIHAECKKRNILLLAPLELPNYEQLNPASVVLAYVLRRVSPMGVWRDDFEWKKETYRQFCRRIHWRRFLFKSIFTPAEKLQTIDTSATYDVL